MKSSIQANRGRNPTLQMVMRGVTKNLKRNEIFDFHLEGLRYLVESID